MAKSPRVATTTTPDTEAPPLNPPTPDEAPPIDPLMPVDLETEPEPAHGDDPRDVRRLYGF